MNGFSENLNPDCPFFAEICNDYSDTGIHMHNFCEIIYVEKGFVSLAIENKNYTIPQNHMVFINPATFHTITAHGKNNAVFCRVCFLPETMFLCENDCVDKELFSLFYTRTENKFSVYKIHENSRISNLILNSCNIYSAKEPMWEMRLHSNLLMICDFLRTNCPAPLVNADDFTSCDCTAAKKIFDYIHKNPDRSIPFDKIPENSQEALTLFEKLCGCCANEYQKTFLTTKNQDTQNLPTSPLCPVTCDNDTYPIAFKSGKPFVPYKDRLVSLRHENEITKSWAIHLFYKVIFIKAGSGILEVRGKRIVLQQGSVVFMYNGEKYRFTNFSPQTDVLFFQFYHKALSVGSREYPYISNFTSIPLWERVDIPTAKGENSAFSDIFLSLYRMKDQFENLGTAYLRAQAFRLVCALTDMHTRSEPQRSRVREVIDYVNSHYTQNLKLAQLGEKFDISYYHLSRSFKEITGKSFNGYINAKRLEHANYLIRHTDYSINKISDILGYCRRSHFTEQYVKMYGIKPSEYRENKETTTE